MLPVTPTRRTRSVARVARPLLASVVLVGSAALALPATAATPHVAAASPAAAVSGPATGGHVTTAALITVEDVQSIGMLADSETVSTTGDAQLNDGGHEDENCLVDKTIRAITGAKSYPADGTGKGYADAVVESTLDKDVYVTESVAQGRRMKDTDRYVARLTEQIVDVAQCQQDPAQGIRHTRAHHVDAGHGATAVYYATVYPDGSRDGGGVAVVRDGTRFGIVSVSSGRDASATTLKLIATAAAARLR
jgi:hypothetical protein